MYNRYIPDDASYTRIEEGTYEAQGQGEPPHQNAQGPPPSGPHQRPGGPGGAPGPVQPPGQQGPFGTGGFKLSSLLSGKDGLGGLFSGKEGLGALFSGKERGGLSSLLKAMKLEDIDTGDILLLLIILYLLVEGDDLELVIALGLVLIMGFGDRAKEDGAT